MALVACRECGERVSSKASACPKCGAPVKLQIRNRQYAGIVVSFGALFLFIYGIVAMIGVGSQGVSPGSARRRVDASSQPKERPIASTPPATPRATPMPPPKYGMREWVTVGPWSYFVYGAVWQKSISKNDFTVIEPEAMFLIIQIEVKNTDSNATLIPSFKIVNSQGHKFSVSRDGFQADEAILPMDSLNPGNERRGIAIFDLPLATDYQLKVGGGPLFDAAKHIKIEATDWLYGETVASPAAAKP